MVNPLLQRIDQRMAEEQALARQEAERQNTGFDASVAKARPELAGAYDTGIQQASAVEEAVRKNLAGEGATAGAALAEKLKAINAPGTEVADLAGVYSGAGGAGYASGMSDVSNLVSRAAEAKAWLEKQPLAFREQTAQDLADALSEIGSDYRGQRADIEAGIPAQIQNLYESLFGQAETKETNRYNRSITERDSAEERRRYQTEWKYKRNQDRIAAIQAERKAGLEAWLAAQESGNKATIAKVEAQQKANERKWQAEQNRLNRENSRYTAILGAGINPETGEPLTPDTPDINTPSDRDKYIIDEQGNVIGPNPNYRPEKTSKTKKGDSIETPGSAKRNRVVSAAMSAVVNPETGAIRDRFVTNKKGQGVDMSIQREINAVLQAQGVDPNSKVGQEIRRAVFKRLAGRRAGTGTYVVPKWVK